MFVVNAVCANTIHLSNCRQKLAVVIVNGFKRPFSTSLNGSEYTERPQYPEILDLNRRAVAKRKEIEWHEKIKSLGTVEEKLFALNLPKYYGWRSLFLSEGLVLYDSLKFLKYVTRTHFSCVDDLSLNGENKALIDENLFNKIKSDIQDALVFEYCSRRRRHEIEKHEIDDAKRENEIASTVIRQINRTILTHLSSVAPHLVAAQVDLDPRIEAFWFVGGMDPSKRQRSSREGMKYFPKEDVDLPIDRPFQYIGSPVLQLRHELPLPVMSNKELEHPGPPDIEHFRFDPRVLGYKFTYRHGTTIPGFWPGDVCESGLISFHTRGYLHNRRKFCGTDDEEEAIHGQAILASYAWLLGQASYKGFSTYNDVTYPFVTQTVVTNGQLWSLYRYQLNTTLIHSEYAISNDKCNFCIGTRPTKLFEEINDNKVIGFNDSLLKNILSFYTKIPLERQGVDLRPYLKAGKHFIANIDDPERRIWLEQRFKHLYSCRPRDRLPYELYHWEKIYKVDHKTRPMDARRRPFELGINPYSRRLDEAVPEYIPKFLRPEEAKKVKWAKTYYPLSTNEYKKIKNK